jgi:aryl-alcohol dehydrogenase-like predicted oxidoreductase
MELRPFARTGVMVSPLCLGAMMFGAWGNHDHDDSIDVIHAALDAGINFIDTADVYSGGESEEIVAKAIQGRRDDVVLATKVHGNMGADPNMSGSSRRWILRVRESLRRLDTDYIDLCRCRPRDADIDETLDAADRGAGQARHTGRYASPSIVERVGLQATPAAAEKPTARARAGVAGSARRRQNHSRGAGARLPRAHRGV